MSYGAGVGLMVLTCLKETLLETGHTDEEIKRIVKIMSDKFHKWTVNSIAEMEAKRKKKK